MAFPQKSRRNSMNHTPLEVSMQAFQQNAPNLPLIANPLFVKSREGGTAAPFGLFEIPLLAEYITSHPPGVFFFFFSNIVYNKS